MMILKIAFTSFIGSILFLFWLAFLQNKKISYQCKRIFFVIVMISFFIPFAKFKADYTDILHNLFGYQVKQPFDPSSEIIDATHFLRVTSDGIIYNFGLKHYIQMALFLFWVVVVVLLLQKQIEQYKKWYKALKNTASDDLPLWQKEIVEQEIKNLNIKKKVCIQKTNMISSPISMGFLKTNIFLPDVSMTKEEFLLIIRHELVHIKQNDTILKILALIINTLHWYNPFCHFMTSHINKICEFCCDEKVALTLSTKQRKRYAELILKFSCDRKTQHYFFPVSCLGENSKNMIKQRIITIKSAAKTKKFHTIFAAMIWTTAMICSTIIILAYPTEPMIYELETYQEIMEERKNGAVVTEIIIYNGFYDEQKQYY